MAVLAALVLSGCGGSSSSHTTQTHAEAQTAAAEVTQPQTTPTQAAGPTSGSKTAHAARAKAHSTKASHPQSSAHPATTTHPASGTTTTTHTPPASTTQPATQTTTQPQQPASQPAATHTPSPNASTPSPTTVFKRAYRQAIDPLKQTAADIGAALRASGTQSRDQNVRTFHSLYSSWQSQFGALVALQPPAKFAQVFSALTGAGKRVKADLREIGAAINARSAAEAGQAITSIVGDLSDAKTADTVLEQKLGSS